MKAQLGTRRNRRGFTLIELIVVLMILVGLAGILIPAVTSMVGRTHTSTASANIAEIANAIQRYETQYMSYPNNFDSLETAVIGTQLNTLDADLVSILAPVTLTTANGRLAALQNAGITSVGLHAEDDGTFVKAAPTTLVTTNVVQGLTAAAQENLGLETPTNGVANKYVCLGVGTLCSMNGRTMLEAPVHFPENGTGNPDSVYGRFIAVFQITDSAGDALERAKLVGVISPHGDGLDGHLAEYFEIAAE